MALETLRNTQKIGEFNIGRAIKNDNGEIENYFNHFVQINDYTNFIGFRLQEGPIKEMGVNGCQVDTIIETARLIIKGLNEKFPCEQNDKVIYHLNRSLEELDKRKKDREKRGVEGYNAQ